MASVVRPHSYSDGAVARPDQVNENETILYNLVNGNIDFANLKAALQNAANGLVKLDANALVPLAQIPVLTADKLPTIIPAGVIVMWSGLLSAIPSGWSLCDGTGATPDLRDKFIYGWSDGVDPGGTGGAATHTHTYSDLPAHSHSHSHGITPNPHTHTYNRSWRQAAGANGGAANFNSPSDNTGGTSLTINTDATSAGVASPKTDAGSTIPPYFKLAFIIKD